MTIITAPLFFADWNMTLSEQIKVIRNIISNNAISHLDFQIATTESWLPRLLVNLGLFVSGSDVKRQRPDYWKSVESNDKIKVGKINLYLVKVDGVIQL